MARQTDRLTVTPELGVEAGAVGKVKKLATVKGLCVNMGTRKGRGNFFFSSCL